MNLSIDRIAPEDAVPLAALHATCFTPAWPPASIATLLRDPHNFGFAAREEDGALRGFAMLRSAAREAEILTLAVAPDYRRQGIATALMNAALAELLRRRAAHLFLEVSVTQGAATALYRKLGFVEVARRARYYEWDGSDALSMRRDLDLAPEVDVS